MQKASLPPGAPMASLALHCHTHHPPDCSKALGCGVASCCQDPVGHCESPLALSWTHASPSPFHPCRREAPQVHGEWPWAGPLAGLRGSCWTWLTTERPGGTALGQWDKTCQQDILSAPARSGVLGAPCSVCCPFRLRTLPEERVHLGTCGGGVLVSLWLCLCDQEPQSYAPLSWVALSRGLAR